MKWWAMPCRASQDGQVMVERSTECGPLEKGMANRFSMLALRTPWTVGTVGTVLAFPRCAGRGYASPQHAGARAVVSLPWPHALGAWAAGVSVHWLSSWGSQAPEPGFSSCGAWALLPMVCGILPDQGSNPRPLSWQADSPRCMTKKVGCLTSFPPSSHSLVKFCVWLQFFLLDSIQIYFSSCLIDIWGPVLFLILHLINSLFSI